MEYLVLFVYIFITLRVIFYSIRVLALYTLMDYRGMPNTWLSLVPFSEFYISYKLLDGKIKTGSGIWSREKTRKMLLWLPYGVYTVTLVLYKLLDVLEVVSVSDTFGLVLFIVGSFIYGLIGYHFSRVYLKKTSPTGVILSVVVPSIFPIYVLMNMNKYRESVDEFDKLEIGDRKDSDKIDSGTLEELFEDVKVDNEVGSGIHLTKVTEIDDFDEVSDDEKERKILIAKEMFDAEVALLEAEKDLDSYSSDALEADMKAFAEELKLVKIEEEERLIKEAERVEHERIENERISNGKSDLSVGDSLELDDEELIEVEVSVDLEDTGDSYDQEIKLTEYTEGKDDRFV